MISVGKPFGKLFSVSIHSLIASIPTLGYMCMYTPVVSGVHSLACDGIALYRVGN
jgi:hypothetical protein